MTEAIHSCTPISRAPLIYEILFTHTDILIFSCDSYWWVLRWVATTIDTYTLTQDCVWSVLTPINTYTLCCTCISGISFQARVHDSLTYMADLQKRESYDFVLNESKAKSEAACIKFVKATNFLCIVTFCGI